MRIAWFRPMPHNALDARVATAFETELSRRHAVDAFDERTAHDFVWKHFRAPYDACLYEIGRGSHARFIHAYALHYPGVLLVHELANVRYLLAVSRLVVVNSASAAELLAMDVPADRIRIAPQFAPPAGASAARPVNQVVRFGVLDPAHSALAMRAMTRARTSGAMATLGDSQDSVDAVIQDADVVIALQGPRFTGPLTAPLLGMSAGRPVIVSETDATANWPALDPQTWLTRGYIGNAAPIAVSIDPRDEEHSLMLAIRRLSADRALRAELGGAARTWWETHATPSHAADSWQRILEDSVAAPPPDRTNLPAHINADGTSFVRDVLTEFGVEVDLL